MPTEGPRRPDVLGSLRRALHLGDAAGDAASAPATPTGEPQAAGADAAPATMHKGAYVVARLYLEGEDAPAHDFAQTAVEAARAILRAGLASGATPLRVTIKQ